MGKSKGILPFVLMEKLQESIENVELIMFKKS